LEWEYKLNPRFWGTKNDIITTDLDNDGILELIVDNGTNIIVIDVIDQTLERQSEIFNSEITGLESGDLDSDGIIEIILGLRNGSILILDGETLEIEWVNDFTTLNVQGLCLFDIDNDGIVEILDGTYDGYIYVFNGADYSLKWKRKFVDHEIDGLIVEDIDDDNIKEIILWGKHNVSHFYVFDSETFILEWKSPELRGKIHSIIADDVDNDGVVELTLTTAIRERKGSVYVFDTKERIQEWATGTIYVGAFGIDDIDNDGVKEIISCGGISRTDYYIWDGQTKEVESISERVVDWQTRSIAIGDLNKDGINEYLIGSAGAGIYIFNGSTYALSWRTATDSAHNDSIAIYDVDQDGDMEIIAGSYKRLYILDGKSGTIEWSSDVLGHSLGYNDRIFIADLDNDGQIEIVTGTLHSIAVLSVIPKPDLSFGEITIPEDISYENITFKWRFDAGRFNVSFKLDPENAIDEADEHDNMITKQISVRTKEIISFNQIMLIVIIVSILIISIIVIKLQRSFGEMGKK
jgi:outer membrane protein assembly factor BamB